MPWMRLKFELLYASHSPSLSYKGCQANLFSSVLCHKSLNRARARTEQNLQQQGRTIHNHRSDEIIPTVDTPNVVLSAFA